MEKLSSFPAIGLLCLLALFVHPTVAQNTVLVTSGALPGGTGSNSVVVGPGNSYPSASGANVNVVYR